MVEMTAPHADATSSAIPPAAPPASWSPPASTCASTIPKMLPRREAAGALPPRDVPRLRLRQHHAAHRQHEHAAARRREPGHPLPRLARAGPRRRGREVHASSWPIRRSPGRSTTRTRAKDLQQIVKTKKTELLFLALFLRLLKPGGRAAVIVPDGVLFGSTNAHKALRKILVEDQKLDAVVSLPSGVFKPYAGVSTAILLFTKTNSGGTDHVWFYDVDADGLSLDDKRTRSSPRTSSAQCRRSRSPPTSTPRTTCPTSWRAGHERDGNELSRARTDQSFCVPKADIVAQGYDLSLNRYKEVVHDEGEHRPPQEILADLAKLESGDSAGDEGAGGDAASDVPLRLDLRSQTLYVVRTQ